MIQVSNNTITMVRGDTARISVSITDAEGAEYIPVEGDTLRFAVKKKYTDETVVIEKQIDINALILQIDPADTKNLQMGETKGQYVYDVEITQADGTVDTFIRGKLILLEEVE